jgi:hypothetical protein
MSMTSSHQTHEGCSSLLAISDATVPGSNLSGLLCTHPTLNLWIWYMWPGKLRVGQKAYIFPLSCCKLMWKAGLGKPEVEGVQHLCVHHSQLLLQLLQHVDEHPRHSLHCAQLHMQVKRMPEHCTCIQTTGRTPRVLIYFCLLFLKNTPIQACQQSLILR